MCYNLSSSLPLLLLYLPILSEVGGFERFSRNVPDNFFDWTSGEYSWWFIIGVGIFNTIFIGGNWAYEYTSVKGLKEAKKVGLTLGFCI